jgi:hypothetical protein
MAALDKIAKSKKKEKGEMSGALAATEKIRGWVTTASSY